MIERDVHNLTVGGVPYSFHLAYRVLGRPVWREQNNASLSVRREADGKYTVRFKRLRLTNRYRCQTTAMCDAVQWHGDLTAPTYETLISELVGSMKRSAIRTALRRIGE